MLMCQKTLDIRVFWYYRGVGVFAISHSEVKLLSRFLYSMRKCYYLEAIDNNSIVNTCDMDWGHRMSTLWTWGLPRNKVINLTHMAFLS